MVRCQLCNDLEKKNDEFRLAFDFGPRELIDSKNNCTVCSFVLKGICCFEDGSWKFANDVSRVYIHALGNDRDTLSSEIYFHTDRRKLELQFFVATKCASSESSFGEYRNWKAIRPGRRVTGYPVLSKGLDWVNSVLHNCITQHKSCGPIVTTLLPKRLLSFKKLQSGDFSVRIEESLGNEGRYNALSYCWGSSQTCTSTSQTLDEYKKAIPWTSLPLTFRDAISFSFNIGIHFLWIDALCIVQDDTKDWQIESTKMADIYQNAFITLAATTSSSGSEGCFSMHHEPADEHELDTFVTEKGTSCLMVRKKILHWTTPLTRSTLASFPLLSRGWVFQERYLSTRALHFCSQELIYVCKERTFCECGEISTDQDHSAQSLITKNTTVSNTVETALRNAREMSDQWRGIVQRYSALKLSKETDRLPALSGLAKRASPNLGEYACGLWKDTLIDDLLWRVPLLDLESGRPASFTGPSWSWASVRVPVQYWKDLTDFEGRFWLLRKYGNRYPKDIQCSVQAAGENPFGEVVAGRLRVRGHVSRAELRYVLDDRTEGPFRYDVQIYGTTNTTNTPGLQLPFFADYVLVKGPDKTPYVGLVLHRRVLDLDNVYRRVGIVKPSVTLVDLYGVDWMRGSEIRDVVIV